MSNFAKLLAAATCLSLIATPAQANPAPTLKIENFVGTVDIETGNFSAITVTNADGAPVDKTGNGVTIDAGYKIDNSRCKRNNFSIKIAVGKKKYTKRGGYKNLDEYPHMKIQAPANTHLVIENAIIFGDVENIGSGDIHVRSCGDITVGDVANDMDLRISGSGDIAMGDIGGRLDVGVSGSGDAELGSAGDTVISVSGSGEVESENLLSLELKISGSGDVSLGEVSGNANIRSSGSSDIEVAKIGGSLDYTGSGSSDFETVYVGGDLSVRTSGSGDVDIDDGNVKTLYVKASGASNVYYDGKSQSAEAYASGAADVSINAPSGTLRTHEGGAGDVNIDR